MYTGLPYCNMLVWQESVTDFIIIAVHTNAAYVPLSFYAKTNAGK